jgi:hypothetical protein
MCTTTPGCLILTPLKEGVNMGMVVHSCNPSTWEAEAGGLRVQGQPWLHNETLSQKNPQNQRGFIELNNSYVLFSSKILWEKSGSLIGSIV